jgi:hypothetical protein
VCRAARGLSRAVARMGGGRSSGPSKRSGSPLAGWAFRRSHLTARSVCRHPIMDPRSDDAASNRRRGFGGRDAWSWASSLLGSPGAVGSGGSDLGGVQVMGASGVGRWGWSLRSAPGLSWVLVAGGSAAATRWSMGGRPDRKAARPRRSLGVDHRRVAVTDRRLAGAGRTIIEMNGAATQEATGKSRCAQATLAGRAVGVAQSARTSSPAARRM